MYKSENFDGGLSVLSSFGAHGDTGRHSQQVTSRERMKCKRMVNIKHHASPRASHLWLSCIAPFPRPLSAAACLLCAVVRRNQRSLERALLFAEIQEQWRPREKRPSRGSPLAEFIKQQHSEPVGDRSLCFVGWTSQDRTACSFSTLSLSLPPPPALLSLSLPSLGSLSSL